MPSQQPAAQSSGCWCHKGPGVICFVQRPPDHLLIPSETTVYGPDYSYIVKQRKVGSFEALVSSTANATVQEIHELFEPHTDADTVHGAEAVQTQAEELNEEWGHDEESIKPTLLPCIHPFL